MLKDSTIKRENEVIVSIVSERASLLPLPRMHWAEAGLGDDVGQVGVGMLSVCEVEVSLSQIHHVRLLHHQRANAARNLHR